MAINVFPDEKDTMCPKCRTVNRVGSMVAEITCKGCGFVYKLMVRAYPAMPKPKKGDSNG